ncbi:unnamed protein product [Clavelina lepadiformis]|uniref:LRRCT domain-containing protein n=1 Tax=Clavelina lepadiformis TaxID=159417 RepID=A0ABP0G3T0_CLALP
MKFRRRLLVVFMLSLIGRAKSDSETEVDDLDNGCTVTRLKPNAEDTKTNWWKMPLPHLNCSNLNATRFDPTGVLGDVKSISLSYNKLIEFHINDLEIFTNLTKLEVRANQLQRIVASPQDDFTIASVTSVHFTHNKLEAIPTMALKSFPNLQALTIYSNKIHTVTDDDFKFNSKLKYLYLGPNPITSFSGGWLRKMNQLTGLSLRGSNLEKVPLPISNMSSLIYLDLSGNHIDKIDAGAFKNCSKLKWIELSGNNMTALDRDAFRGVHQLKAMDFSDNLLETLPQSLFSDLNKESLNIDLYENPLNCNCSLSWFKTWTNELEDLDISNEIRYKCEQPARNHNKKSNQVSLDDFTCESDDVIWTDCQGRPKTTTSLPPSTTTTTSTAPRPCPDSCVCFDGSGKIHLSSSGASYVEPAPLPHWLAHIFPRIHCVKAGLKAIPVDKIPTDVRMVSLSGNKITTLDFSDLSKFPKLSVLDLKKNEIAKIKATKKQLPQVTSLNLRFNNLSSITKDHFRCFPNLKTVALYHNKLTLIPEDLFAFNRKLTSLYLGPNPVKKFKEDFVKNLNLRSLSLRNMSLTAVPASIGQLVNLSYVDLSDNLITEVKNSTFSKCTKLFRLSLENNKISNIEANAFNGATSLSSLLLSENQIKSLPSSVFTNISQEELEVELWENPFVCDCKLKPFKKWVDQMEAIDPTIDIRFQCNQPLTLHDQYSDQLSSDDFTCDDHGSPFVPTSQCKVPNTAGQVALAVVITFLCTLLCGIVAWRCTFKHKYGHLLRYASQRDDYADMEELQ